MLIERVEDPELIARLGQSSGPRSDGLHLSTIYKDLMQHLQPARFKRDAGPYNTTQLETGLVFENMLERGLAEKFATRRPGEVISREGIIMSPDGINDSTNIGEEYKCTWMSSRAYGTTPYTDEYGMPSEKYLHWFIQMKGYAKWLRTREFLLRALHVNGDYKRPFVPQLVTHKIRFSDAEIDENWTMLINHASSRGLL